MDQAAQFDRDPDGDLHLGGEGGHSADRIVHAEDMTGREVERALLTAVRRSANIEVLEYHYAVNLLSYVTLTTTGDEARDFLYAGTQLLRWLEVDSAGNAPRRTLCGVL